MKLYFQFELYCVHLLFAIIIIIQSDVNFKTLTLPCITALYIFKMEFNEASFFMKNVHQSTETKVDFKVTYLRCYLLKFFPIHPECYTIQMKRDPT